MEKNFVECSFRVLLDYVKRLIKESDSRLCRNPKNFDENLLNLAIGEVQRNLNLTDFIKSFPTISGCESRRRYSGEQASQFSS